MNIFRESALSLGVVAVFVAGLVGVAFVLPADSAASTAAKKATATAEGLDVSASGTDVAEEVGGDLAESDLVEMDEAATDLVGADVATLGPFEPSEPALAPGDEVMADAWGATGELVDQAVMDAMQSLYGLMEGESIAELPIVDADGPLAADSEVADDDLVVLPTVDSDDSLADSVITDDDLAVLPAGEDGPEEGSVEEWEANVLGGAELDLEGEMVELPTTDDMVFVEDPDLG